jgi:hypothetical protein
MNKEKAPLSYGMLAQRYSVARLNLLIMLAFTLLNVVMVALGSDSYMLFSATIPYGLVQTGMYLCGKLSADWYEGDTFEFLPDTVLYIMAAIAVVIMLYIFLCWLLSRKGRYGFFIAALVYFALDTLFLLSMFNASLIVDLVFHAWVIYYLIIGTSSGIKMKKAPADAPVAQGDHTFTSIQSPDEPSSDTPDTAENDGESNDK